MALAFSSPFSKPRLLFLGWGLIAELTSPAGTFVRNQQATFQLTPGGSPGTRLGLSPAGPPPPRTMERGGSAGRPSGAHYSRAAAAAAAADDESRVAVGAERAPRGGWRKQSPQLSGEEGGDSAEAGESSAFKAVPPWRTPIPRALAWCLPGQTLASPPPAAARLQ